MDKIYDQREELHKIKAKTERVSRKSECAGSVAGCEHWDETEERSKNKMKTYEATDIWSSVEYGVGDEKNHQFVKYEDHLKVLQELEREMLLCVGHLERSLATGINKDIINTFKKYKGDK